MMLQITQNCNRAHRHLVHALLPAWLGLSHNDSSHYRHLLRLYPVSPSTLLLRGLGIQ